MTTASGKKAIVTLPTVTQILITREFDAPRALVWKAWTTPELVRRWWHAERGTVTVCEIDLRPGGAWRYAMVTDGGYEVAFHGEYREVVAPERLVSTEVYEGAPGDPAVNTATFEEREGRTVLTLLVEHATKADRDMHIESGMEGGLQDALDLLEALARSL